jgi:hypothetical protein
MESVGSVAKLALASLGGASLRWAGEDTLRQAQGRLCPYVGSEDTLRQAQGRLRPYVAIDR